MYLLTKYSILLNDGILCSYGFEVRGLLTKAKLKSLLVAFLYLHVAYLYHLVFKFSQVFSASPCFLSKNNFLQLLF